MMKIRGVKILAFRVAQLLKITPNVWMFGNPFKIHEFLEVSKGAHLQKQHVVLDIGCGKGFQTQILARSSARAIGIDISERAISQARWFLHQSCVERRVEFICARIEDADLIPCAFDRVFSFCTFEHIPDIQVVLSEILRLLKPGGELHVSVDSLANVKSLVLLEKHKRDHSVVQYFTPVSIRRELEMVGLEPFEIFPIFTSDFARNEFKRRIEEKNYGYGPINRVSAYKALRDRERQSNSPEGIMLVARARRPISS